MKKDILFRVVFVLVAMIALSWLPQPVLAQHGGHGGGGSHGGGGGGLHGGGGGGFHGSRSFSGGGHFGYGGGHSSGGYHGGGYYGGHGGYGWGGRGYGWGQRGYGWGGRHWGHGYGWGFGFGWPFWGWGWGYPYGYGYSPWYYAPYLYDSYPYYGPSGYADPDSGNHDPLPADPSARPQANQNGPTRAWRPEGAANTTHRNSNVAALAPRAPVRSVDRITVTSNSYGVGHSMTERAITERASPQSDAPLRPEMQKAMQRLRGMPPFAREREIETGRYRQFSPEEKHILRNGG